MGAGEGDFYGGIIMVPKDTGLHLTSNNNNNSHTPHHHHQLHLSNALQRSLKDCWEMDEFVSGALAGAMTKAVLAPLETISFVQVIVQQGLQGLWAGNTINMLRIIPTQAIELVTFECVKRAMTSAQERWNQTESPKLQIGHVSLSFNLSWLSPVAVAGAATGIVSTLVCHPLEVLKDRLTVSPDVYPNLSIVVRKIYREGGIGALHAGISPTLIGMLPYSTCYYFMYETIKKSYCLMHTYAGSFVQSFPLA